MEDEKTVKEQLEERDTDTGTPSSEGTRIVFTGDEIASGMDILPGFGTYRDGEKIYSKYVGLIRTGDRVVSVMPLKGVYMPRVRDYIIAEITGATFSNWTCNINSPYDAAMSPMDVREYIDRGEDISKYYTTGDLLLVKVTAVTKSKYINVGTKDPRCRKLVGGLVASISPSKVPRLIGKAGSMINMIKDRTGCLISVGQNGLVWLRGENEAVAADCVKIVDEFAHTSGLTDKVSEYLDKKIGKAKPAAVQAESEELAGDGSNE